MWRFPEEIRCGCGCGHDALCTPAREIKDILYTGIIRKTRYPGFFMLDQYMLDIPKHAIQAVVEDLEVIANEEQRKLLKEWAHDNELD